MPSRSKAKQAQQQLDSESRKNGAQTESKGPEKSTKVDQIMRMPMTKYLAIVGMHTSLLAFSALYLPRSALLQELPFAYENGPLSPPLTPLEALTARPTLTLFSLCLGTLLLQTWWSNWLRLWWVDSIAKGTEYEKKQEKLFFTRKRLTALLRVYGALFMASLGFHILLVLFGAPITKLALKTYLLALLIAVLTVLPPAFLFGPPTWSSEPASFVRRWTWVRLFAELSTRNPIERAIVYPTVGTMVGSWLGIIPIALDWERPWQAWPLTPAFGAILGYILASIAALTANAVELVKGQV